MRMPKRPGRPKKPVEIKRRAGNPGGRALPVPVAVVTAAPSTPRAPKGLERPGRSLWRAVWRDAGDWLAPTDAVLVRMLCEAADERENLRELIAAEGYTFTTAKGYVGIHPVVSTLRKLEAQIISMLSMLGFSPADRTRLGLVEVKRAGRLEDLLRRRQSDA